MEALKENLKCCIDLDLLEDPVTLPCGHNLCLNCAKSLMSSGKSIKCPLDNKVHSFPQGANSLSINYALKSLILQLLKTSNSSLDPEIESIKKGVLDTFLSPSETLEIIKVTPIKNEALQKKFNDKKAQLKGLNDILVKYHGTSMDSALQIAKKGFKIPESSTARVSNREGNLNFGLAVYCSSYSSTAINYSYSDHPVLIVCKVILGRVLALNDCDFEINSKKMKDKGYDSVFCPHENNINMQSQVSKGHPNDEYAIYNVEQILPIYIVEIKEKDIFTSKEFKIYDPLLQPSSINFDLLVKLLKNGSAVQKKNILTILGDLCKNHRKEATKILIQYNKDIFPCFLNFLNNKKEQFILASARVLWNASFDNRLFQKMIYDRVSGKFLLNLLLQNFSYQNIQERISGVLANLTHLEPENSINLAKEIEFGKLFECAIKNYVENKTVICRRVLIIIANVFEVDKQWVKYAESLGDILDSKIESIQLQANRVFANVIGYTKEWLINGYKPTLGEEKI